VLKATPKKILGDSGEVKAITYLQEKGWSIIDTNVRIKGGELDIIATDPATQELVFVEVKTRSQDYSGDPAEAVDTRKATAFINAGINYARNHHLNTDFRFDIIAITPDTIEQFENITFP